MLKKLISSAAIAAIAFGAAPAFAQSHSVANTTNPPNEKAASAAVVEATPGAHSTAESNSGKGAKGTKDAQANKGKAKSSKGTRAKTKVDPDISKGHAGNTAKETMQRDPSETVPNEAAVHAFDTSPAKK